MLSAMMQRSRRGAHLSAARGGTSSALSLVALGLAPYSSGDGCCAGAYKLSQLVWSRQCSTLAESSRSAQLGPAASSSFKKLILVFNWTQLDYSKGRTYLSGDNNFQALQGPIYFLPFNLFNSQTMTRKKQTQG